MSDKKETTTGKPQNEQPQGSATSERPQSVYIQNSAELSDKVTKKGGK